MRLANPFYDAAFKFLMADEKAARLLLSAIIRENIVSLAPQAQEQAYLRLKEDPADQKSPLAIQRLDYTAVVLTEDGKEKDIALEVQKMHLSLALMRFRRYLGMQLVNSSQVRKGSELAPRPLYTIYLLNDTYPALLPDRPIVRIQAAMYDDYSDEELVFPIAFRDSLHQRSWVVQAPLLPYVPRNSTEEALAYFNRRYVSSDRAYELEIDPSCLSGSLSVMSDRLLYAASDKAIRDLLEAEEFSRLEWEMLQEKNKGMAETIAYQASVLAEKDSALAEKDSALAEKDSALAEKDSALAEKERQIAELMAQLHNSKKE